MKNKKIIFWDNDGVLVDTEKHYFEATRQILKKENFDLTEKLYIDLFLIKAIGPWHLLDSTKYTPEIINLLKEERNKLYMNLLLTKEIVIEGAEYVVSEMAKKYRMAIVTSSKPDHFKAIHSRTGMLKYFEFFLAAGDYTQYKPNPEPYLKAVEKSGLKKEHCIVIEDSVRGLKSAKGAGLDCIIIQNKLTKDCDFSEADFVVSDISMLKSILL